MSSDLNLKCDDKKPEQKTEPPPITAAAAAQTPMEMTPPTVERGAFRKLFMKLGEKVGTVKISELSPEYLNRVKEVDAYKEMLCNLSGSIMHALQQNPSWVPEAESKMEFDSPESEDPFELLGSSLKSMTESFSTHAAALRVCINSCNKLAELTRTYHKRGRRALHFIRTFINVDYVLLSDQRQKLITRRQEMDFAKHEYTNNPTDQKKGSYEKAVAGFNEQLNVVFNLLDTIPIKKEKHRLELIKVLDEMRKFHSDAAAQCFLVCKAKW